MTLEITAGRYLVRPGRRLTVLATVRTGRLDLLVDGLVVLRLRPGDSISPEQLAEVSGAQCAALRAAVDTTLAVARPPDG